MENRTSSRKTRVGLVVSDKMDKTVVVAIADRVAHPLYKKIVKSTYKLKAHDQNNECGVGDRVRVMAVSYTHLDVYKRQQGVYDAIVLNPGAFTHYSYAIMDALKAVSVPCVEVHISNIHRREEFRHKSVTAMACVGQICGLGLYGYEAAMRYFLEGGAG